MASKYEWAPKSPTVKAPKAPSATAPNDLPFGNINFNQYYKSSVGKRRQLTPNISDKQAQDLAKKLGIAAPKVGTYRVGGGRRGSRTVTGMDPKAKNAWLENARKSYENQVNSYNKEMTAYNKTMEPYNKEVEAYNTEVKAYKAKIAERDKYLQKELTNIPNRGEIGRAKAERRGQTANTALAGDMGRKGYEQRMKGQNMTRAAQKKREGTGRQAYEAIQGLKNGGKVYGRVINKKIGCKP